MEAFQRDVAPTVGPTISTTASSATKGTQKSDGLVAMQFSPAAEHRVQPCVAAARFPQPAPGWRLLQAVAAS